MIFDKIAFAPAMKIPLAADHCDYYANTEHTCEEIGSKEVFFPSEDTGNAKDAKDKRVTLQALFFPNPASDRIIVYLHGNGGHVYMRIPTLIKMSRLANVFILSYRGYGKSQGKPSEAGVYRDARAAVRYVREQLGFPPDKIYLYGRSLGAGVAVEVAQDEHYAGLILVTPFLSGKAMARERNLGWVPGLGRPFDSVNKLANIASPALFIHGTEDEIVPFEQGLALYERYPGDKTFHRVEGGRHNNLAKLKGEVYWQWLRDFITHQTDRK